MTDIKRPMFPHADQYSVSDTGCWLWLMYLRPNGYGEVTIGGKNQLAHRASYRAAFGDFPAILHVLHRCDTPACINPAHLYLGTDQDNSDDKLVRGKGNAGQVNPMAKLTTEQVDYIREKASKGSRGIQSALARQFQVNRSCISKIVNGGNWNA